MKRVSRLLALIAGLLLAACGASSATPAPTAAPQAIATLMPTAAIATIAPTVPPPAPTAKPSVRAVTFNTADNITLEGRLYGEGVTAIILSNMGDNDPAAWDQFAPTLAAHGYARYGTVSLAAL